MIRSLSSIVRFLACILASGTFAGPALAQTYTWTGAGDGTNWPNPANWFAPTGFIPSNPTATYSFTSMGQSQPNIFLGNLFTVGALNFNGPSASYNLLGPGTLDVVNQVSVQLTPAPQVISANLQTSNIFVDNGGVLFAVGSMNPLNGAGFNKTGNGGVLLGGNNTYSGTTNIFAGTIQVGGGGTTGTLGTGNVLNNGTLSFSRSDAVTVPNAISGLGGLIKFGTGVTTLTGTNTYTGPTSVNTGTLLLNGNQSAATGTVTVNTTLGGTGIIGGAVSVNAGGTIRGDSGTGTGSLRLNSNVTLTGASSNGATLQAQVTASGATAVASKLDLTGGAGNLSFDPTNLGKFRIDLKSSGWVAGQQYTVTLATLGTGQIRNNGVTVVSGSIIPQTEYDLLSDYALGLQPDSVLAVDGSNLVLTFTPVPEPVGITAIAVGFLGLGGFIRKNIAKQ